MNSTLQNITKEVSKYGKITKVVNDLVMQDDSISYDELAIAVKKGLKIYNKQNSTNITIKPKRKAVRLVAELDWSCI